jgi:hypothetical protein
MSLRPLLLVLSCLATSGAGAADESALRACRAEPDDARRLACYDREIDRANPPAPQAAAAPEVAVPVVATAEKPAAPVAPPAAPSAPPSVPPATPAADPAIPVLTAEERFGRERVAEQQAAERAARESQELGELKARVTEIWTRSDGLMVVTLDNGQVWKQNAPDYSFRLKTGDTVKIQPASMKSYLMSGPSKRSTRVSRVK